MQSVLERLPEGARVAVIRLRSLGDCVLTTPALRILRQSRPDLKIAVVVEAPFRPVFEGNPDVDELLPPHLAALRRWRPRLCINFHGGTRSTVLAALSGARFRAGFAHFRGSFIYNVRIPTAQQILGLRRKVHTAEHLASAIFYLGAPRREIPRARLFAECLAPSRPYAVLHPLASASDKTWPAGNFLTVAERLPSQCGLEPVFISGAGEDLSAFSSFRTVAGAPLRHVKSLLASAGLFIGNDSGPAHMAAALGVPAVVLFGASDRVIWAPWKAVSEVLAAPRIDEIPPAAVMDALERLGVRA